MSTLAGAARNMQTVMDALDEAVSALTSADDELETAAGQLDAVGYPDGAQAAEAIKNEVASLRAAVSSARATAEGLRGRIISLAGEGRAGAAPPAPPATTVSAGRPLGPRPRFDPAKAQEIRPYTNRRQTVGRLYDAQGQPIGELIWSGKSGPGAGGPGLKGRWKQMESLTEHAEGHVAAIMRGDRIMDATLYLNRHPCGYNPPKPEGCFNALGAALRPGARLTIYVVNANGSAKWIERRGTGEGIE